MMHIKTFYFKWCHYSENRINERKTELRILGRKERGRESRGEKKRWGGVKGVKGGGERRQCPLRQG